MTGFDIAVFLIVGIGAVTGFVRGFVQETVALSAWIIALVAIRYFHTPLAVYLQDPIGTESGAAVLSFGVLLLVPYFVVRLLAKWMGAWSRASVLGPIDRVLGFGFGALKGIILVVLAFSVLVLGYDVAWGPDGRPDWVRQARTYPFVNAASEALVVMIAERRQEAADAEQAALAT